MGRLRKKAYIFMIFAMLIATGAYPRTFTWQFIDPVSGDNVLMVAKEGKRIRLHRIVFFANASSDMIFRSGSTQIFGTVQFPSNTGWDREQLDITTDKNEPLVVNFSSDPGVGFSYFAEYVNR
jgi:hypothetical protein